MHMPCVKGSHSELKLAIIFILSSCCHKTEEIPFWVRFCYGPQVISSKAFFNIVFGLFGKVNHIVME